jgi:hypothetical protein
MVATVSREWLEGLRQKAEL